MNSFITVSAFTVALFAGAASAQVPLAFSDTAVDYTNSDLDSAWLSLQTIDNELVLVLDDQGSAVGLPAIVFTVPDAERTDFFGNDIGAIIGDIDEVEVLYGGSAVQGIDVIHEDVTLGETASAYQSTLETQGFTVVTSNSTSSNLSTLVASSEDGGLRLVLHRVGSNVTAHLVRL